MRMRCGCYASMLSSFRWVRDTTRPGGASEEAGSEPSSVITRKRGADPKKLRSCVTDILLAGI